MEFINLQAQFRRLEAPIRARINAVLEHGQFIMGPEIAELERKLASFTGARHAITCGSGTEALLMPLMAWGIGPGDAVFVPPFTFFATAEVVALVGATPVFVDVDPVTFNIVPDQLAQAIEAVRRQDATLHPVPAQALRQQLTPRAVIPVDLFGIAAEYETLLPVASAHGLFVLEDGAQAFGGRYHGKPVCGLGAHAAATSFFPAKPLGCYGDGGAIFTDDDDLAAIMTSLRVHGKGANKYDNVRIGINGRMDTLQAAIMLPKLDALAEEIDARQRAAARYATRLSHVPGVTLPAVPPHCVSAYAQYSILLASAAQRDTVAATLHARGVPTAIYYPKPLHRQPVFAHLEYEEGDLPISDSLSRRIVSLPMYPFMPESDIDTVCDGIESALRDATH